MFNIGWVFYSEKQRENLETIISMTQEPGTLDELGLGSVRDGFANLFFPGTTTIQTRAKYFILVPWILNEIYRKNDDFTAFRAILRREEIRVIELLLKTEDQSGLIGKEAKERLKRMPSSIYWNGLKTYGIITQDLDLSQVREFFKRRKKFEDTYTPRRNTREDLMADDLRELTGNQYLVCEGFEKLPQINVELPLTKEEAQFLKVKILESVPQSLLAYILRVNLDGILKVSSFEEMVKALGPQVPLASEQKLAVLFDKIMQGAYIRYNYLISRSAGYSDQEDWELRWSFYKNAVSQIDGIAPSMFDGIFRKFKISNLTSDFCRAWINGILDFEKNLEQLDKIISQREFKLKGPSRSRLSNRAVAQKAVLPIGISLNNDSSVNYLSYRFAVVQRLLADIFEGLRK